MIKKIRIFKNYPEIGTVVFESSKRAKRIVISIKSPTQIRIAVPRLVSFKKAESFVASKVEWIRKQQNKYSLMINVFENKSTFSEKEISSLINRAKTIAEIHRFNYNTIKTRKMKTRWGSCTHKNNICLNTGLIGLTVELQDYVILHELVHTRIKNHGKDFWDELSKFILNPKLLNKKLTSKYGIFNV